MRRCVWPVCLPPRQQFLPPPRASRNGSSSKLLHTKLPVGTTPSLAVNTDCRTIDLQKRDRISLLFPLYQRQDRFGGRVLRQQSRTRSDGSVVAERTSADEAGSRLSTNRIVA